MNGEPPVLLFAQALKSPIAFTLSTHFFGLRKGADSVSTFSVAAQKVAFGMCCIPNASLTKARLAIRNRR
jgi:hypothetical protein